jgi:hypothetical protein
MEGNTQHFQAILQLLQLVVTLMPGDEHHSLKEKIISDTRKSFDYVDAITNLMVRTPSEVVAAASVACGGHNAQGIISTNSTNETLSSENVQVRPHMFSISLNSSSLSLHPRTWRQSQNYPPIFTRIRPAQIVICKWQQLPTPA